MAGFFKKILKGVLIGGGTVLSLLCPPVGGAVISAGMQIGAGAAAVGSLIKTGSNKPPVTIDTVTSKVQDTLAAWGLTKPAGYQTTTGSVGGFIIQPWMWLLAAGAAALLIFRRRR